MNILTLRNPDLALPLYVAVVIAGVMLTKRWDDIVAAIHDASIKAGAKAGTK